MREENAMVASIAVVMLFGTVGVLVTPAGRSAATPTAQASVGPSAPMLNSRAALAAVRRHRVALAPPLDHAALTLGACVPSTFVEVSCATELIWDKRRPPTRPQRRTIGFSRVAGRWEVALW